MAMVAGGSQVASDNEKNLLVWPPNQLLSDVNSIALNVNLCKNLAQSESFNKIASKGSVKGRKSKTFGGCDRKMGKDEQDVQQVTISTLSL